MRGRARGGPSCRRRGQRGGDVDRVDRNADGRLHLCACEENVPLLNELRQLDVECLQSGKQNLRRGVQRAIRSLKLYPLPVRTEAEACALEGVGSFTARRMLRGLSSAGRITAGRSHDEENKEPTESLDAGPTPTTESVPSAGDMTRQQPEVRHRHRTPGGPLQAHGPVDVDPVSASGDSRPAVRAGVFQQRPLSLASRVVSLQAAAGVTGGSDDNGDDQTDGFAEPAVDVDVTPRRPTSRARREPDERQPGGVFCDDGDGDGGGVDRAPRGFEGDWEAFLVIDNREHECVSVQSALLQKGVACESRQLPLGDMLWAARRRDGPGPEVLLGFIVERKTVSDLASSIIDGRYAEQKRRLRLSGLRRCIYLVEGNMSRQSVLAPMTLRTALASSQACGGFAVVRCGCLRDTVDFLARTHGHICSRLRRSCSSASRDAAAVAVAAGGVGTGATGCGRIGGMDGGGSWGNPGSLLVPAMTYEEYASRCAKHAPTVSSRQVLGAMMRQAPGCSAARAEAVVRAFKSPLSLMLTLERSAGCELRTRGAVDRRVEAGSEAFATEEERIRKGEELLSGLRCSGGAGTNKLPQPLRRVLSRLFLGDSIAVSVGPIAPGQDSSTPELAGEDVLDADDGCNDDGDNDDGDGSGAWNLHVDGLEGGWASQSDVIPMSQGE